MHTGHELHQRASKVIPGGVNSATRQIGAPYGFASAEGARMVDLDGNSYIDFHAAFGATLLGYRHPSVDGAVRKAIEESSLFGLGVTEAEVVFAEQVNSVMPSAEMVITTMSGSEANIQAIRLARAVTERDYIVKFQGCFHGSYDSVARNVISPPERAYKLDPLSKGIPRDTLDHTLIAEFNDLDDVAGLFASYPGQIAGVILEPVAHNVGCMVATDEFVLGLRKLTDDHQALLIFDEVITGFRHSLGGFQASCPVTPDLTSFGKGLGNGYAVAGLGGRRHLMNRFAVPQGDVLLAGTFNGNPVSMAAAIATIAVLRDEDPDFYSRTSGLAQRAREGLESIIKTLGIPAQVSSYGSVFAVYFLEGEVRGYRDLLRNDNAAYVEFHRRMTDRGMLMLPMSLKRNHVSGAHTAADIDAMLDCASDVLGDMVTDGVLH
jgi:glutamate-1-semialdehyde 2,1-aminomutase